MAMAVCLVSKGESNPVELPKIEGPNKTEKGPAKVFRPVHIRMNEAVKSRLKSAGIYADWRITIEFQSRAKEWVLRGVESGGAVEDIGYYVTYSDLEGQPLLMSYLVSTLAVNGLHGVVVAPALVKVEMLRIQHSYILLISRHVRTNRTRNGKRWILNYPIFLGARGYLDLELWGKDRQMAGVVFPCFKTLSGEFTEVPRRFQPAVLAATAGANCIGCSKSYFLRP
jgi:hypothetical protein